HFWNVAELSNDVGNWGLDFKNGLPNTQAGNPEYGIGEPASTKSVISVAAHSTEIRINNNVYPGDIAYFSSVGPIYTGEIKPDISAPGVNIASSVSSYRTDIGTTMASVTFNGKLYEFSRFSGTSMS